MPFARRRAGLTHAHPLDGQPGSRARSSSGGTGRTLLAIAVVVVVAGLAMVGARTLGLGGAPGSSGIAGGSGVSTDPGEPTRVPAVPLPGHEVYGFVPYWEMDRGIGAHLAETKLTTLALFSVTHKNSGEMSTSQTGYKRIRGDIGRQLIREAHERGTRVELVYTAFGEKKNRSFYKNAKAQARWIEVLVEFADDRGFDGINVDVEGLPADLVPAYGEWVGRLREALRAQIPDAQVSVATQANQRGAAMAAVAVDAGADRVFVMAYDYRWPGSQPGASSPIERTDGEDRDIIWSLDRYAALGVPLERTILGLPLYGVTWPVSGPGLGAPSIGRGDTWVPRRNLGVFEADDFDPTYEPTESVEFYSVPAEDVDPDGAPWTAVYFDSPRSLTPKLAIADSRGLAGAGFWAIGYERGLPGYTELIATFAAGKLTATP